MVVTELRRVSGSTCDLLDLIKRITNAEATLESLREIWIGKTSTSDMMTFVDGLLNFEKEAIELRKSEIMARTEHGNCRLCAEDR